MFAMNVAIQTILSSFLDHDRFRWYKAAPLAVDTASAPGVENFALACKLISLARLLRPRVWRWCWWFRSALKYLAFVETLLDIVNGPKLHLQSAW